MVNGALTIGAFGGILLSTAFLYFEVGRFAAPQVPESLFDERKLLIGYAAGLFVGIPLAFLYLLFVYAITVSVALFSAIIDLAILLVAVEVAQWLFARSHYFGQVEATSLNVLAFRASVGAILTLAILARYLGGPTLDGVGLGAAIALSGAVFAVQVTGGLESIPRSPWAKSAPGGPLYGAVLSGAAFAVLGIGISLGDVATLAASLLIIGGLLPTYRRLRRVVLGALIPPEEVPAGGSGTARPFGRRPGG